MPLPLTSLASVKSGLIVPFWYRLTQVVLDKGQLNRGVTEHKVSPETLKLLLLLLLHFRLTASIPGQPG